MVKFVSDSSCDLLEMEGVDFASVPLTIYTDEKEWVDDATADIEDMLTTLENHKGRSYTACPSVEAWLKAFEGADEIYVTALTSGLSGTYHSAYTAREMYLQEHPEAKIMVFDTLSTGPEMRLILEKIIELKNRGLEFEQVCEKTKDYMKRTRLFFAFQSLHNFAQNGRINKAVAATIGLLGIRIVGIASEEGTIKPIAKSKGESRALKEIIAQLEQIGFVDGKVRLSHTFNSVGVEKLKNAILERFPSAEMVVYEARALTSYYGERGALFLGIELPE